MEDRMLQQVDMSCRKLQSVESPHRSRLLTGPMTCGEELTQEQIFWQKLWSLGGPRWNSLFLKDCSL